MKILQILFVFFGLTAVLAAQNNQPEQGFQAVGKFYIQDASERVLDYHLFDDGRKIRLIGESRIEFWDVETVKLISSSKHENADIEKIGGFSSDKSKFVIFSYEKRSPIKDAPKIRIPAGIFDADTGKLIKTIEGAQRHIESAIWSSNNQTLVTASGSYLASGLGDVEVTFWDAATLEKRDSVIMNNVTWHHLTPDGERLLTTTGEKKSLLGFGYASEKSEVINVWNTRTGKIEKQFAVGDEDYFARANKLNVSPDGKTFAYVLKNRKKGAEDKLVVRHLDDAPDAAPRYEIKANPKIAESRLGYSPDGNLVALDAGKNVQFYEIQTGAKKSELLNNNAPDYYFDENRIALFHRSTEIQAVDIAARKSLFVELVVYKTHTVQTNCNYDYTNHTSNCSSETVVDDYTRILPHRDGKTFLAYSNQSLKIYDAATGKVIQSLVVPPTPVLIKRRKRFFGLLGGDYTDYGPDLISRAAWSDDFQKILIHDDEEKSVTIWTAKD